MGPLSYFVAFVCLLLAGYYWYNNKPNSEVKDSNSPRTDIDIPRIAKPSKSREKFLEFDRDCTIRLLTVSDLNSVKRLVKGDGGVNYFKDNSLEPFLNETNTECLGFGVQHKASNSIICTQFIMMVDNNKTGLVLGAMIDTKYLDDSRIIYMRLSNEVQSELMSMFDNLGKHRCVFTPNNESYINNKTLDWKIKFNLDDMSGDNSYYLLQNDSNNMDNLDGIKVNGDFKECDDIDNVINILQNKFKINDVLIDWRLFQVKYLKKEIEKDIENNKLTVMINENETGLCLVYGSNDYYVYGETSHNVLSGVRFAISRNSDENLGAIFVHKAKVDNNDNLTKIFEKVMQNPIVCLDYDMHMDGH